MRRWKRRLLWAAALTVLAVLAIPATVAKASAAIEGHWRRRGTMQKLAAAVVLLAAAAVVGGGATFASASSTAAAGTMSLVAVDVPKSEIYVDAGKKGDGAGDTLFFREILRDRGTDAGKSEVMCVYENTNVGRCHGTLRLAGGTLEASGGVHFSGRFSLPIVGGTRSYLGARGVLTVIAVDDERSRYTIELAE